MFSLQIQILNFTPSSPTYSHSSQMSNQFAITIRFGPLQTNILINNIEGSGGKRLLIELEQQQMENLFKIYAFGLFIKNQFGKFWCLLSLENVKIGKQCLCNGLVFYDDDRNVGFHFGMFIKVQYFNPKVPKNNGCQQNKGEVKCIQTKQTNQKNIKSFLDGRKNIQSNNKPPLQPPKKPQHVQQKQIKIKTEQKFTNNITQYKETLNSFPKYQDDNQTGIYLPPMMEFTNQQPSHQIIPPYEQNQLIQVEKNNISNLVTQQNYKNKQNPINKNNTMQKFKQNTKINKEELREKAHQQVEKQYEKNPMYIKIAIQNPKTNTYQLIPLSQLSQKQLKQYSQKQKNIQKNKKQQQKNKEKQQKMNKKIQLQYFDKKQKNKLMNSLKNQNIGISLKQLNKQKIVEKNQDRNAVTSKYLNQNKITQQQVIANNVNRLSQDDEQEHGVSNIIHPQQINQQQQYQSDFQSFSNAGSLLKSRKSPHSSLSNSRNQKKKNERNQLEGSQSQSVSDYGYSQDFDSYSQSMLSKNSKNKKQYGGSISQISGSLTSMSQRK